MCFFRQRLQDSTFPPKLGRAWNQSQTPSTVTELDCLKQSGLHQMGSLSVVQQLLSRLCWQSALIYKLLLDLEYFFSASTAKCAAFLHEVLPSVLCESGNQHGKHYQLEHCDVQTMETSPVTSGSAHSMHNTVLYWVSMGWLSWFSVRAHYIHTAPA